MDGDTPLPVAIYMGHLEVVRLLVEAGADNASALHKACIHDDVLAIQTVLVSDVNVDVVTRSSVLTPLYIACMFGNVNAARLQHLRYRKDKAGRDGTTPLHVASNYGHLEVVRLLVEAGADDDEDDE